MCGLGPLIGTLLISSLWGQSELIISKDIAGVPIIFYTYVTALPAVLPSSIIWCLILSFTFMRAPKRNTNNISKKEKLLFSIKLGAIFGLLFSIHIVFTALFSAEFIAVLMWSMAGILTGIVCAILCFPIWYKQLEELYQS
jgi:hypothetical protein